jgi:Mg2+ and Co2+ transporter CorA
VDVTIFDGRTTKPCSAAEAKAAANQPGIAWIDLRLQGDDSTPAQDLLQAVGIDSATAHQVLTRGLGTDFLMTPTDVHGVCWIDDDTGSPAEQVFFTWNQLRLVTVRTAGDAAIEQVRQRVTERVDVLDKDPSTLLGVVLQLMLASVQRGLTRTMIGVGRLDIEIIATATPKPPQAQSLNDFRTAFQPLALRFPMYVVNVQASLIDPGTVAGLDTDGMAQMQQFLGAVQGTSSLIDNLASAIRNAAQDIQAQVSTWQGNRINVLTIVTMVFLPISFLTGYFGMNFTWLDNQLDSFWSWMLLGVALPVLLVAVCVSLLRTSGYAMPRLTRRHRQPASSTAPPSDPARVPSADQGTS